MKERDATQFGDKNKKWGQKKKVRSKIRKNFKGSESFKQSNAPQTSLSDGKYIIIQAVVQNVPVCITIGEGAEANSFIKGKLASPTM